MTTTWEKATEWPLTIAAIGFLAAYAIPIISPESPSGLVAACTWVTWLTWALFVIDFLVRLGLAEDRRRFIVSHWLDVLVIVLPLLRPLRLLRLVTMLSVLNRRASHSLRGRVAVYVAGVSALLAFCGALAVLDAERTNPDANITSFADALWWALTTMTTVGYGDRFPTTGQGRLAAAALMVGGVTLLGAVTATLASWLVEQVTEADQAQAAQVRAELAELRQSVDELRRDRDASTSTAVD